jgi:hypothetical protein
MSRIFLMCMLFLATIALPACNRTQNTSAAQPTEIAAVIDPFFAAVRRGDQKTAEKYVAPGFLDDSKVQFAEMSALLKKSPRLAPVLQQPQKNGYFLTFAGQDDEQWITSEVRLARYGNKHMIDYWDVNAQEKPPELVAHVETMKNARNYGLIALAVIALAGLAALIWLVRNRTHLIAPEPVEETRRVAATVRSTDDSQAQ